VDAADPAAERPALLNPLGTDGAPAGASSDTDAESTPMAITPPRQSAGPVPTTTDWSGVRLAVMAVSVTSM